MNDQLRSFRGEPLARRRATCVLAACLAWALPTPAFAFHEGGSGFCEGCHVDGRGALKGSDPSSTCLRCHGAPGRGESIYTPDGSAFTAGGDFYWLRKTFQWREGFRAMRSVGDSHGHNVVALDEALTADGRFSAAPGGTYPSAALGCTSCHDPHAARGSSYRLLGGEGYEPPAGETFLHPAPVAQANPSDWRERDDNHVAYGAGMSAWCSNCHRAFEAGHDMHPVGERARLPYAVAETYNSYRQSGDATGSQGSAYLALVPVELGITDATALDPTSGQGPQAGVANVMCLTCHRAHASAFESAGRWDFGATFLADSHPQTSDAGAAPSDGRHSYYGRDLAAEMGPYQRQLCNKCHLMD